MPPPDRNSVAGEGEQAAGYRVVARRYRPQRFADLVGQEHVARGLSGAIESGRVGHAYLFTGARGVGKTSAARILAKALQCQRGPAAEPCDACDACLAIAGGQDIDVLEIDAASNRGIDEIRQLRQNVAVRPARGRFKVYIIDEVHMLTREAFNALLKTLEEPPPHVKFVLCTTEPDKLPVTILSRCQRFDFHVVDAPAIAGRLAQIVAAEGMAITAPAIDLVARRANGSMRDSQSLLEQLLGGIVGDGTPREIGIDDVHALIGTGRDELVGAILRAIFDRDPRAALAGLDAALRGGADCGGVLEQILGALRDCLVASVGSGREALREGDGLGIDLLDAGPRLGTATVLAMLQIVDQALARMRSSAHPTVLAEMAVVRLAALEDLDGLATLVGTLSAPAGAVPAAGPPERREKKTADLTAAVPAPHAVAPAFAVPQPSAAPAASAPVAPGVSADAEPLVVWRECGRIVGGLAADFADLAVQAVWHEGRLAVTLPAGARMALDFLRGSDVVTGLQRALVGIVGRPASVAVDLAADEADAGGASSPGPKADAGSGAGLSQAALVRAATAHPLVRQACELFDGSIRRVDPPRPREVDGTGAAVAVVPATEPVGGDAVGMAAEASGGEPDG
ncbi:MAG: DNA polymerase III subunit gamma/tau [Planctomycetes bacterium]|nr:DNA polymerase III subunit gamma/tau [Planctomycetota bacterium]